MTKGNNRFKDISVLGIVTCNREDMLKTLVDSIDPDCFSKRVIVNNGAPLKGEYPGYEILQSKNNPTSVACGKNAAVRELRKFNPNAYIFLLEEDIEIIDNNVWEKYATAMLDSGILGQLAWPFHGGISSGNINADGTPRIKATIEYDHSTLCFYNESYAAFTLYHGAIFSEVGYMDENFVNAGEHLDHYQRIANGGRGIKGVPFFFFPDIKDSHSYIKDQYQNFEKSAIRSQPDFMKNFGNAWKYFKNKHGKMPNELPKASLNDLMKLVNEIEKLYARKDLL